MGRSEFKDDIVASSLWNMVQLINYRDFLDYFFYQYYEQYYYVRSFLSLELNFLIFTFGNGIVSKKKECSFHLEGVCSVSCV